MHFFLYKMKAAARTKPIPPQKLCFSAFRQCPSGEKEKPMLKWKRSFLETPS
jgi:hypothetical protein